MKERESKSERGIGRERVGTQERARGSKRERKEEREEEREGERDRERERQRK